MEILDIVFKGIVGAGLGVFLWQFLEFKGSVKRFLDNDFPHLADKVDKLSERLYRHLGEE